MTLGVLDGSRGAFRDVRSRNASIGAKLKVLLGFSVFFLLFPGLAHAGAEAQINERLNAGGAVHLASGVYIIEGPVQIHSNTILTGESDTVLKVSSSSSQWFVDGVGILDNADTSLHDVEISGFQIDGNLKALPQSYADSGNGDHNAERAIDIRCDSGNVGSNISIHDLKIYDCYSDGIHIAFVNNVNVYNNFVSNCQHSGIYFISVVNGLMDSNKVAGITSDCLRFDNCENNIFRNNVLYSFTGDSNGAYENGHNGVQIADQGFSHGGGSDKPTTTTNVEGYGNTFSSGALRTIWLDSTGKGVKNVYLHDNQGTTVTTNGTPVTGIDFTNISFSNPPTVEMSERVFSSIFDILNINFQDLAITNQTDDQISYNVTETTIGNIAGGVKIIGFRNQAVINNRTYMQNNNSTVVKSEAVLAPSSLDFWNQGVDKIDKDIKVEVNDGLALEVQNP